MSTPAYVDSETITQFDGAQSSRVPVPLPNDPYVAVRQARLVDTDTESDPEEASSKVEESQPFGSRVPLMTEEFEAFDPSGTRTITSHSPVSSDSTAPDRKYARAYSIDPIPGMPARIAEAAALSPSSFRKRYRSSYETPSPSSSPSSSPTLPVRKRYRGTSKLILDTDSEGDELGEEDTEEDEKDESLDADEERENDEGPSMEEEEEAALRGQQQVVLVVDTAVSEPLGLGYGAARRCALESTEEISPSTYELGQSFRVYTHIPTYVPPAAPVQTPPSPEWSLGSLPVLPSSPVVPSPIASPVATPAATISVAEDHFLKVGAQLELHGSILHDHTQRLDALPHTLFEVYDRDLRELYTRPVLALEAWAGQTDAQRAALWHAIYDIKRENHDLRRQLSEERRERLELTYHVARMERRQEFRGE
uniref:Uncharacterized protein n=1 Tax=Tanacetum cinerariifolium TaxID=118510 RepID=A0A699IMQ2_TANCI|nr:hypothetical protein [Tanacetum cinerariifolium]